MKPIPPTPEVLRVAQRVVWFKEPMETISAPYHFLAHVMTYGTLEDLRDLKGILDMSDYIEALEHAPPGIFDKRSWAYWNLICGRHPVPPMPVRQFP